MTDKEKDIKNYLNSAYCLDAKITALRMLKEDSRLIQGTRYDNTGCTGSGNENYSEIKMTRIADMSLRIDEELKRLSQKKSEIFDIICSLNDDELETVLIYRFLKFMTIEQIADEMHYTTKTVTRKLHKAIEKMSGNVL